MQVINEPSAAPEELKETFERQGYCHIRGLFNEEEVEDIKTHFEEIHSNGPVKGYFEPVPESEAGGDVLKVYPRFVHPHRFTEKAKNYMLHPKVEAVLRELLGTQPLALQSMYYYKPPGALGQAMHQDNLYLMVEPGTCIAAWTAIDDADAKNGGMAVVPKTDDMDIVCPGLADKTKSFTGHLVKAPKGKRAVIPNMKAGDTLFFNGSLIHGSGPNRSKDRWRRSFIGHYAPDYSEKLARFYFPVLDFEGNEVTKAVNKDGGPCGTEWDAPH
ncbi:phytanoyl-CoA dioxygenase family protein [Rubellicoccus peritrichatus]|uniref:Phytanoyl-CoA dioxygenase family protein n=1 Tax=Rubellicoccus peritrichatus TaxID=3080537 RepID=A0AAQ3LE08_9BACT|nr:phytanoyl-CoA dioxygenase family protein [Puniceicoccus sp. CR14]WOO42729.1 phytanoyl-CoA dioxygenase family protein [Puniceicoccus sp. CR14]